LGSVQYGVRGQGLFHISSARFENLQKISVATVKIFENLCELSRGRAALQSKDSVDDMVGPGLVRRI
jgi:hypothetical protein